MDKKKYTEYVNDLTKIFNEYDKKVLKLDNNEERNCLTKEMHTAVLTAFKETFFRNEPKFGFDVEPSDTATTYIVTSLLCDLPHFKIGALIFLYDLVDTEIEFLHELIENFYVSVSFGSGSSLPISYSRHNSYERPLYLKDRIFSDHDVEVDLISVTLTHNSNSPTKVTRREKKDFIL